MLEIRTSCENCKAALPNESSDAMICSYECTFCAGCVEKVLENVCPNCGGGFEKRPTRPKAGLKNYPAQKDSVYKPVKENSYLEMNRNIDPRER